MGNMLVCLEPPKDAVVAGWDPRERNQDTGPLFLILSLQHDIIVSVESPQPLPRPRISCCSPQVSPFVSGASTRPVAMRFQFLACLSPPPLGLLPVLLLPRLLIVIMKCLFCLTPYCCAPCYGDAVVPLPRTRVSHRSSSTSHSYCSPSTCPAGWQPQPMPSRVWLIPICFFSKTAAKCSYIIHVNGRRKFLSAEQK
jgi:hypothetical protein